MWPRILPAHRGYSDMPDRAEFLRLTDDFYRYLSKLEMDEMESKCVDSLLTATLQVGNSGDIAE